jgi:hypothetical protein
MLKHPRRSKQSDKKPPKGQEKDLKRKGIAATKPICESRFDSCVTIDRLLKLLKKKNQIRHIPSKNSVDFLCFSFVSFTAGLTFNF